MLRRRLRLTGAVHEFEGLEPTVVFSPHFYGLDAGATAVNMNIDREFTSIYTPQANAKVDQWIKAGRLRWGRVRLFHRIDGVKANVAGLRSGQVLYLLPDMDFGAAGSVFVPFFGVQTAQMERPAPRMPNREMARETSPSNASATEKNFVTTLPCCQFPTPSSPRLILNAFCRNRIGSKDTNNGPIL